MHEELEGLKKQKRALETEVEDLKKKVAHDIDTKIRSDTGVGSQKNVDFKHLIDELLEEKIALSAAANKLEHSCTELRENNAMLETERKELENILLDLNAQVQESEASKQSKIPIKSAPKSTTSASGNNAVLSPRGPAKPTPRITTTTPRTSVKKSPKPVPSKGDHSTK